MLPSFPSLLAEAAAVPPLVSVVDLEADVFLAPGDMEARIAIACEASGQPVPSSHPEVVRCILDSLALAYRRVVWQAASLSDRSVDVVHVVGGGSRNALLCELTASACGVPVLVPRQATFALLMVAARLMTLRSRGSVTWLLRQMMYRRIRLACSWWLAWSVPRAK